MRLLTTHEGLPRLSWGAVIAGIILSLVVYLIMSVLGTAIGATLLSPMNKPDPLHGFGFGSGAWMIVTTVVAVFVGSYFAGRCAPVLGWLHGLLAWAVMILMVVYGMTSLMGSAIGTAGSIAATGAQVGANMAGNPAASADSGAGGGADSAASMLNSARQQVQGALASAASEASSPQAQQDARQAADTAARVLARASWFSFAALIVGAIISIVSGNAGFRHQPPAEDAGGSALRHDPRDDRTVRTGRPVR